MFALNIMHFVDIKISIIWWLWINSVKWMMLHFLCPLCCIRPSKTNS